MARASTRKVRPFDAPPEHLDGLGVALANMVQGISVFDAGERLVYCNPRFQEIYALPDSLAQPGVSFHDILRHRVKTEIVDGDDPEAFVQSRLAAVRKGVPATRIRFLADGRWIAIVHKPLPQGGWVATHEDITELRRVQQQIAHLSQYDALTDLPNRTLLHERIEEALSETQAGKEFALLCLDLDRFNTVNDIAGHAVGDEILKAVAMRLRGCVRADDTVARLASDNFCILQRSPNQPHDAIALANRVQRALRRPFRLEGNAIATDASIGIAVAPGDGGDPDRLLKNASVALRDAKIEGRGTYRFFAAEMDARMKQRRQLDFDLRKAIRRGEFELHYQPQLDLARGEISALEALLRWRHPQRGLILPGEFLSLAETNGLIVPIGEWVLRQACAEAARWPAGLRVAVNLSPAQITEQRCMASVLGALAAAGLQGDRLELEITESMLLQDSAQTRHTLNRLRDLGARIVMDDFGTGYSSLSSLRSVPFDKIKIDRSFVAELPHGKESAAIVRAVAGLGASLGITTTAEGVETTQQLQWVRAAGCAEVQGNLVSPPRPADEIAGLCIAADAKVGRVAPSLVQAR